ncbi:MAG: hypothetical protein N2Z74_04875 [Syntrophales bacterium]|nr:hypothetical protein [Syntrophales bacterium]
METFWSYVHTHQAAVIAVLVCALVTIYFLIKQLIKIALLSLMILIVVGAYFYFTAPKRSPEDIDKALRKMKEQTSVVVDKGKQTYEQGKMLVEKGRRISEDIGRVLKEETGSPPRKD